MDERLWIGFDLGGTKMIAALLNEELKVVESKKKATKGQGGADQGLERIIDLIHKTLEEANASVEQLGGIGIGCPGVVDHRNGVLREAPNLGWKEVPVQSVISAHFGVPVSVLNDVDAGAYGEYAAGAGRGVESLVAVFPGTGIG
ncbi:MAG: ROK family protein, partial [Verrucomicrobiota bacterium]